MAAYSAVTCLLQTLEQRNPEIFDAHTAKALESIHAADQYFYNFLEEAGNKNAEIIKSLEEKIRITANHAEYAVEMKISDIIDGLHWSNKNVQLEDLPTVVENMDTIKKEMMEIIASAFNDDDDPVLELSRDSLIGPSSTTMLPNLDDDIVRGLDDDLEILINVGYIERLMGNGGKMKKGGNLEKFLCPLCLCKRYLSHIGGEEENSCA